MVLLPVRSRATTKRVFKLKDKSNNRLAWPRSYRQPELQTEVNTPSYSNERRATRRFAATCDAELVANLSILDTNVEISTEPLVFFGQTIDLSPRGIGLVIPSVHIDERYCDGVNQLRLAVHLPNGAASFHVNAVRCMPVNNHDLGEGYVVGTRILRVLLCEEEFIEFLGNLSSKVKV